MRRLERPGEWRLSMRWTRTPRLARVIDRFPEGRVYRFWFTWLFVKLMVKT